MADELVIVGAYRDLPEALIVQGKLQAQGIECFLADANIVRMDWYWSNLIGGVKLQVSVKDRDAAMAALKEEIPSDFTAEEVGEEYQQPACPKCGSLNIGHEETNRGVSLVALYALALPVPLPNNVWKCEQCDARWVNTEDEDAQ